MADSQVTFAEEQLLFMVCFTRKSLELCRTFPERLSHVISDVLYGPAVSGILANL